MDRRVEHYADAWSERVPPNFDDLSYLFHTYPEGHVQATVAIVMYDPYVKTLEPGFEEKLSAKWPLAHRIPKGPRGHEVRIYCSP